VEAGADGAGRRQANGCRHQVPSSNHAGGRLLTGPFRERFPIRTCIPVRPADPSGYPARRWYPATLASHPATKIGRKLVQL